MQSELIVDVQSKEVSIALLEDGRLVSLQRRLATSPTLLATYTWLR